MPQRHCAYRCGKLEVRREGVMEQFAANGASPAEVLKDLAADAQAVQWQEKLDEMRRKIERLGPINLAAIEQFNEQSERKKYLDAQNADLTSALDTLEQAIRRSIAKRDLASRRPLTISIRD